MGQLSTLLRYIIKKLDPKTKKLWKLQNLDKKYSRHFVDKRLEAESKMWVNRFGLRGSHFVRHTCDNFFNTVKLLEKERRMYMTDEFQWPSDCNTNRSVSVLLC